MRSVCTVDSSVRWLQSMLLVLFSTSAYCVNPLPISQVRTTQIQMHLRKIPSANSPDWSRSLSPTELYTSSARRPTQRRRFPTRSSTHERPVYVSSHGPIHPYLQLPPLILFIRPSVVRCYAGCPRFFSKVPSPGRIPQTQQRGCYRLI